MSTSEEERRASLWYELTKAYQALARECTNLEAERFACEMTRMEIETTMSNLRRALKSDDAGIMLRAFGELWDEYGTLLRRDGERELECTEPNAQRGRIDDQDFWNGLRIPSDPEGDPLFLLRVTVTKVDGEQAELEVCGITVDLGARGHLVITPTNDGRVEFADCRTL